MTTDIPEGQQEKPLAGLSENAKALWGEALSATMSTVIIGENDRTRFVAGHPRMREEAIQKKIGWDSCGELFMALLSAVSKDALAAGMAPEHIASTTADLTEHAWREMAKRGWLILIKRPDDA